MMGRDVFESFLARAKGHGIHGTCFPFPENREKCFVRHFSSPGKWVLPLFAEFPLREIGVYA